MADETAAAAPEDPQDVVVTVVSFVSTITVLLLALAFRRYRAQQARNRKPDPADAVSEKDVQHVGEQLAQRVSSSDDVTLDSMLAMLASAPAMRKLGTRAFRSEHRALSKLYLALQRAGASVAAPTDSDSAVLLLLVFQLRSTAADLQTTTLRPTLAQLQHEATDNAAYVLSSVFELSCKRQWLQPALVSHTLQAGLQAGVWSDTDPECLQIVRSQFASAGGRWPDVGLSATAHSWMGQPVIGVGTTVEVGVTVARRHAGPATAILAKKVARGKGLVSVVESYRCFIARDTDGDGGGKGSMVGIVDVDVESLEQREAHATIKINAPRVIGTYHFRVVLRVAGALGVHADTACSFDVVGLDHPALQQDDDDDYD